MVKSGIRRTRVNEFVGNMRARIAREARPTNAPMLHAVTKVGYATSPRSRFIAHLEHRSSNYLMNLAEAVFQLLYPNRFELQQHVLFNCWSSAQCWYSEVIFTHLGQAYTTGGCGFNYHEAGGSNGAAFLKAKYDKEWSRYRESAWDSREYRDKLKVNHDLYEAYRAKVKDEMAEVEYLEAKAEELETMAKVKEDLATT